MKRRAVYEVRWRDSTVNGGWAKEEGVDPELVICETVGYMVRRTRRKLSIAQSRNDEGQVSGLMSIPRSVVVSIRRLS